jgi:hypothetical protein
MLNNETPYRYRGTEFTFQPIEEDGFLWYDPRFADPEDHDYVGDGTDPCRHINCAESRNAHL